MKLKILSKVSFWSVFLVSLSLSLMSRHDDGTMLFGLHDLNEPKPFRLPLLARKKYRRPWMRLLSRKLTPVIPSKSFQSTITFSPMMMLKSSRDEYWTLTFVQIEFSIGWRIFIRTELLPFTSGMRRDEKKFLGNLDE